MKLQNQILKHFLRMFVDDKYINYIKQLLIVKFVYIKINIFLLIRYRFI